MKISLSSKNKSIITKLTDYKLKINDKAIRTDISTQELSKLAMSRQEPMVRDVVMALHSTISSLVDSNKSSMADTVYCNSLAIDSAIVVASSLNESNIIIDKLDQELEVLKTQVTQLEADKKTYKYMFIGSIVFIFIMFVFIMFIAAPDAATKTFDTFNNLINSTASNE
jgi:hypothetical protein